jgi:hypothetical protein
MTKNVEKKFQHLLKKFSTFLLLFQHFLVHWNYLLSNFQKPYKSPFLFGRSGHFCGLTVKVIGLASEWWWRGR